MKSRFILSTMLCFARVSSAWAASTPPLASTEQPKQPSVHTSNPGEMPASGRSLTLDEAYTLALKSSEQIAQRGETIKEALARVDELKANVMPHLSISGQETLQQSPNISGNPANQTNLPLAQIVLTQPLFSGLREFLAFKAGRKQVESATMDQRRSESLLYHDVAQAYLDLLRVQKEIGIRQFIIDATKERIKQLEYWVKIGRSRDSEVLAARAQLAQTEAQVEISRGQERVSQEALRFLTGLEEHLLPQGLPLPEISPIEPFVEHARHRSDVEARKRDLEFAQLSTEINRRQRWPTIGLVGDYYLKRAGLSANVHYDAIFAASLPIFDGGAISAQVRQAEGRQRSSEQALSLAQRSAEREARSAYRSLEWSLAAVNALRKAEDLADKNVKAQAEDYRRSLVTNLEVLDSINTLQSTRLTLNQSELQATLARVQLEVAAGGPNTASH